MNHLYHHATSGRGSLVILAAAGGLFLASLDFSINVSLPVIRDSLNESLVTVQWIIVIYHASRSGMGFGAGGLGDAFGLRRLFLIGVVLNTLAVGFIALQHGLPGVVGFRVLQGLGAGILFTASPALVARAFGPDRRGAALGVTIAAVGAGQVTATLGGGWLAEHIGWQAIFWTRVPIGLFFLAVGALFIHGPAARQPSDARREFDWAGMVVLYLTLFLLVLAISFARLDGWISVPTLAPAGLAAAGFAIFVWVEARCVRPVFPASLLRSARFRAGAASNLLATVAAFVMWFLFPFFISDTLHRDPVILGAMLATMGSLTFVGSALGGWLTDRWGDRGMTFAAGVGLALSLWWMSTISSTATLWNVAWHAGAIGLAFGVHQASVYALTMRGVPSGQSGAASATLAVTQTLGTVLSVSLGTIMLVWRERLATAAGLGAGDAFVRGYTETFAAAAVVAVAAGVVALTAQKIRSV